MSQNKSQSENQTDSRFRPPGLYNPDGQRVNNPMLEWDPRWERDAIVKEDFLHLGAVSVLTRFVGVDQSQGYAPEPMIYRTDVSCRFPSRKWGVEMCDFITYPSVEAAERGHFLQYHKWKDLWHMIHHLIFYHEW